MDKENIIYILYMEYYSAIKKNKMAGHSWLMHIILATWKAETGRIKRLEDSPGK
jgi:hypothetical protein